MCVLVKRELLHTGIVDLAHVSGMKQNGVYTFFNFFFFMTNDFGMAHQEDILPPNTNPCYAEDREDLSLMKR